MKKILSTCLAAMIFGVSINANALQMDNALESADQSFLFKGNVGGNIAV